MRILEQLRQMGPTTSQGSTIVTDHENLSDGLTKDIKTIEAIHLEMVYNSSLRFSDTVLEALDLPPDSINLKLFDIRDWTEECLFHITKIQPKKYPLTSIHRKPRPVSFSRRICPCFHSQDDRRSTWEVFICDISHYLNSPG